MSSTQPRISRITIGRLFNLGSYEHVRYELTLEIPETSSATTALVGAERLLVALNPREPGAVPRKEQVEQDERRVRDMKERLSKDPEEFERYYRGYVGAPEEYIQRCEQSLAESIQQRKDWQAKSQKARALLDDLGGSAEWRDAKLDWDSDDWEN